MKKINNPYLELRRDRKYEETKLKEREMKDFEDKLNNIKNSFKNDI